MTTSTQDSVMEAIRAKVEDDRHLVLVVDPEWGNTGSLYARHADGLDPVGPTLHYDFQRSYFHFRYRYGPTTQPREVDNAVAWYRDLGPWNQPDWCVRTMSEAAERVATLLVGHLWPDDETMAEIIAANPLKPEEF